MITVLVSPKTDGASPDEWLRQKDARETQVVFRSERVAKQGILGMRWEEARVEGHPPTIRYYFPLQEDVLILAINLASFDSRARKRYQGLAESVYERFRLPSAPR